ncbi:Sodium-coupled monocarboxylate transporter 2 [Portunus trituberculatus]|uniref:Sodium-coupled monocarboxylate transporter 2 n=1 Tax=Portunus trituberculatus TaxID=210409 RepID=A0A5B7J422_PORTR|nr:Sodium-coupled monocarboxylate transporter 2 [Portunus trituberculatus]
MKHWNTISDSHIYNNTGKLHVVVNKAGGFSPADKLIVSFMLGIMWLLLYSSGAVAYVMYRDCDPLISGRIEKPDQILPYLVINKLGHFTGLPGFFVAAVYGGVLR